MSGTLHLSLVAPLLWHEPQSEAGSEGWDQPVGITLAMFGNNVDELDSFAPTRRPSSNPEPETTPPVEPEPEQHSKPEPEPEPKPEPKPESKLEPAPKTEHQPEAAPIAQELAKPLAAPLTLAKPVAPLAPEVTPHPKTEPTLKPVPKPKLQSRVKSKPRPKPKSERRPRSETKPKPRTTPGAKTPVKTAKQQRDGRRDGGAKAGQAGRTGDAGSGKANPAVEGRYLAALQRAIAKHRRYPRQAQRRKLEGVVTVYFVILADGRIQDIRVAKGSGSRLLDEAAVETLKRLAIFKPIPREIGRSRWPLRVPIRFALK